MLRLPHCDCRTCRGVCAFHCHSLHSSPPLPVRTAAVRRQVCSAPRCHLPVTNTPECRVCEENKHVQVLLLSPHSLLIYFLSKTDYSPLFLKEKNPKLWLQFKPAAVHSEHCCAENNLKGFLIFIFTTIISYCVPTDSIFLFLPHFLIFIIKRRAASSGEEVAGRRGADKDFCINSSWLRHNT